MLHLNYILGKSDSNHLWDEWEQIVRRRDERLQVFHAQFGTNGYKQMAHFYAEEQDDLYCLVWSENSEQWLERTGKPQPDSTANYESSAPWLPDTFIRAYMEPTSDCPFGYFTYVPYKSKPAGKKLRKEFTRFFAKEPSTFLAYMRKKLALEQNVMGISNESVQAYSVESKKLGMSLICIEFSVAFPSLVKQAHDHLNDLGFRPSAVMPQELEIINAGQNSTTQVYIDPVDVFDFRAMSPEVPKSFDIHYMRILRADLAKVGGATVSNTVKAIDAIIAHHGFRTDIDLDK